MRTVLLLLYFLSHSVFGQRLNENQQINDVALGELMYKVKYNKSSYNSSISEEVYLFPNWVRGNLTTVGGNKHYYVWLKYNLYSGELTHKKSDGTDSSLVNLERLKSFDLYSDKGDTLYFKRSKLTIQEPSSNHFYQVLYEGKSKLLLDTRKRLLQYDVKGSSLVKKDDVLLTKNRLILIKPNSEIYMVRGGVKKFLNLFPEFYEPLKAYINKNKIDVSKPEGKVYVVRKYDEISSNNK